MIAPIVAPASGRTEVMQGACAFYEGYAQGAVAFERRLPVVNKPITAPGNSSDTLEGDLRLLASFKRGERAALARVLQIYAPIVATAVRAGIRFTAEGGEVMRVGQDLMEHDVELIVQETFVRAFSERARQSYDGVRAFKLWVLTIARNLVIDLAREKWRGGAVLAFDSLEQFPSNDLDPAAAFEESELDRLVKSFANALGEPDKSVYRLRYVDLKNIKETGDALNMTEIRVRRCEAYLRERLLAYLREHGFLTKARVAFASSLIGKGKRVAS